MIRDLARKLRPQFEAVVAANEDPVGQAYSPDFSSAARRAVKAKALGYLSALGDSQVAADLLTRYGASSNMTDQMSCLGALNDSPGALACTSSRPPWQAAHCSAGICAFYKEYHLYVSHPLEAPEKLSEGHKGYVHVVGSRARVVSQSVEGPLRLPALTHPLAPRFLAEWQRIDEVNRAAGPERQSALAAFYEQWKGDELVVLKWLGLSACSDVAGNRAAVDQLLLHPAFDIAKPNCCYAAFLG